MRKNKKINLLWIAASVPYSRIPHAGGQTFYRYFRAFTNDDRFSVRLIGFNDGITEEAIESELAETDHEIIYGNVPLIRKICNVESKFNPWSRYAGMLSNYYAFSIKKILARWKRELYDPDVIILDWTNIVMMTPEIKKLFPNAKVIASEVDVTFVGFERKSRYYKGLKHIVWLHRAKWEKKLELKALRCCDLTLPQNPDNCVLLEKEGIDKRKLMWLSPFFENMSDCIRNSNGTDILFFGAMSRIENYLSAIWFIENVMPALSDLNLRFIVMGGNPPKQLLAYKSDRVIITGFVEKPMSYFASSLCFVAPLVLGAGIKVKVLEALSCGIPVLTNEIGIEGIPAKNGEEYIHCETPEEYACAIRKLINGSIDSKNLEEKAKQFISDYSFEKSTKNYIETVISMGG